jgi:sugar phosphate isomerase/epimerase
MRVGFAGTPVRAFKALWAGRSSNRPEDLIEYSSSLKLKLFDFSEETLNLAERDLTDIESLGFTSKQASQFRHLAQLAKVGGVNLTLTVSPRIVLSTPDPTTHSKAVTRLRSLWAVAGALRCALLAIPPGYTHGSPNSSLNRLERALDLLELDKDAAPTVGIEVNGRGLGTVEMASKLCKRPGVVPVINIAECIPRSQRERLETHLGALFEFAVEHSNEQPIWIRYCAYNHRVPAPISEGWPIFRRVAKAIRRFEEDSSRETCVLIESPRRELDAILFSSYYHLLGSAGEDVDNLSVEELVKAGAPKVIDVGSRVLLQDISRREQLSYVIVEPGHADPFTARISYESPIGRSLLGKESGSLVEIAAPGGNYVYEIVDIS